MHDYPLLFLIWLLPLVGAVVLWAFGPQLKTMGGPIGAAMVVAMRIWAIAPSGYADRGRVGEGGPLAPSL